MHLMVQDTVWHYHEVSCLAFCYACFSPDLMHDLGLGTMHVTTLLLLKHLQNNGLTSLSELNKAISEASLSRP